MPNDLGQGPELVSRARVCYLNVLFTTQNRADISQIGSPRTLKALVRTCRVFRDIFTPLLYRFVYFEPLNLSPAGMISMSRSPPPAFRHTKRLDISIAEYNSSWFSHNPYFMRLNDRYSASITRVLEKMTSLNSFRYTRPRHFHSGLF